MKRKKLVGEYSYYEYCRFCGGSSLAPVINLGYVPLAGGFFSADTPKNTLAEEHFFPLQVCFCPDCLLVQTNAVVNRDTLFQNYFYHSSAIKTMIRHFTELSDELAQKHTPSETFIVEIGANDGAFITALQANGFRCVGVDPATNVVAPAVKKGLPIINEYFSQAVAGSIVQTHGQADCIFSFNTLAHIEDMHDIFRGIKTLLKPDGYLAFEIHYLGSVVDELQYDMIYHEHQYYYSLLTLQKFCEQHSLKIFDAVKVPTHAGSLRVYAQHSQTGKRTFTQRAQAILQDELSKGYDKKNTYVALGKKIAETKKDLLQLLKKLKKQGKRIAGYGASGRGTIISNYCGLDHTFLDYIIDDAPAKKGVFTPGVHLQVFPSSFLQTPERPDYIVLFAWSFLDEIRERNQAFLKSGGKFIVPLPKVRVVG